jgi:hypothetical protein
VWSHQLLCGARASVLSHHLHRGAASDYSIPEVSLMRVEDSRRSAIEAHRQFERSGNQSKK